MSTGDVLTRERSGVWENVVEGEPDLREVFVDRDLAVENGERIAEALGSAHVVDQAGEPESGAVEVPPFVQGS